MEDILEGHLQRPQLEQAPALVHDGSGDVRTAVAVDGRLDLIRSGVAADGPHGCDIG